ncbi:MAG: arginase [Butyrivibrio sp.]|nr:arginase [Butyrivibrio sp.]
MFKKVSVFNFSGIYDEESFYLKDKGSFFCDALSIEKYDLQNISGTNCMCDDNALSEIRRVIKDNNISSGEVHYIDSGNYHYMSAILTEDIKTPFSLVVLDHHPDMQPPLFGNILSCGGWVLDVIENNKFLKDVHIIGADRQLIEKLDKKDAERVNFYDTDELDKVHPQYPVYLSIDKDVLSKKFIVTNWDQGEMSKEELFSFVKKIMTGHELIGVDICGECAIDQEGCDLGIEIEKNDSFNLNILKVILC